MKPLQGIRVLDLSRMIAGGVAGMLLADFGADVVKVEQPGAGDPLRNWRLLKNGTSVWWQVQSRNKRSVALDLKNAEAQEIVRRLAAEADVLIENFRPGALEGSQMVLWDSEHFPDYQMFLEAAAKAAVRTLSGEIVYRLQQSLDESEPASAA